MKSQESDQVPLYKKGDRLQLVKMCENARLIGMTVGTVFKAEFMSYYADNGGLKRTHAMHCFYGYKGYNIPQDALAPPDPMWEIDMLPVGDYA